MAKPVRKPVSKKQTVIAITVTTTVCLLLVPALATGIYYGIQNSQTSQNWLNRKQMITTSFDHFHELSSTISQFKSGNRHLLNLIGTVQTHPSWSQIIKVPTFSQFFNNLQDELSNRQYNTYAKFLQLIPTYNHTATYINRLLNGAQNLLLTPIPTIQDLSQTLNEMKQDAITLWSEAVQILGGINAGNRLSPLYGWNTYLLLTGGGVIVNSSSL